MSTLFIKLGQAKDEAKCTQASVRSLNWKGSMT